MTMMKRRPLMIGAGLVAALGGAGVALRASQKPKLSPAAETLWASHFERVDGGDLLMSSLRGRPLLINFWAPWCKPCVKELPDIQQFAAETPGWNVLGLALDSRPAVQTFLSHLPLSLPLGLAGLTGFDLVRMLGNVQGGLPFSVAFDVRGEISWRKLGPTELSELRELARS